MVTIAISSDNHLDVNRVNIATTMTAQSQWLLNHRIDYYFHGGDLFNNFARTRRYFADLQSRLGDACQVFYIAGNHDMVANAPFNIVEHLDDPRYLHNRFIDLGDSGYRMVGNNGWYDYSFSQFRNDPQAVATWKRVYWIDSLIKQPMTDQERMHLVLQQVQEQLRTARQDHKKVFVLTHFAPRHQLLAAKPAHVRTKRQNRFYQMINAMMGSDALGQLLESDPDVAGAFYGHLHGIHPTQTINHVSYYHQAVGVKNKRHNEWQASTFIDQWKTTLRTITLP